MVTPMPRRNPVPSERPAGPDAKSGQALLESFGVIILLCFLLFGMVQLVLMYTATEVIQYSADASARARAVGFNPFMIRKVNLVASIPNAGIMTSPTSSTIGDAATWNAQSAGSAFDTAVRANPRSSQYWTIEYWNIPLFLGSTNYGHMYSYLDYEDWDTVRAPNISGSALTTIDVTVRQDYPLRMPLFRAFSEDDEITIRRSARLADHAELYLE